MKAVMVLAAVVLLKVQIVAMSFQSQDARIAIDGKVNCPYISHNGGRAYLQISLHVSDYRPVDRGPVNLAVVIDRSGSMADERKMDHAKSALFALIDQLRRDDVFSLIMYDHEVDVLMPAKVVDGKKGQLRSLVEREIYPRGNTNLGGGMIEGFRQVERYAGSDYVNRVILLSDGLANQGITDAWELRRIAGKQVRKGISLTTMGVGLAYNENLMMGLSETGGGNYYFLESGYGLAAILQKEFNCLGAVVAQNAWIELELGRGVRVNDVIGCENRMDGRKQIIQLGDLYSNERREVTVELDIPEGIGSLTVATGRLKFDRESVRVGTVEPFSVTVRYTRDAAMIEKNRDIESQAKIDVAISTRSVEEAMRALDEGRREDAAVQMYSAHQALMSSPAAKAGGTSRIAVLEQAEKIQMYSDTLDQANGDARKAKKAIQFDNYRRQRNR